MQKFKRFFIVLALFLALGGYSSGAFAVACSKYCSYISPTIGGCFSPWTGEQWYCDMPADLVCTSPKIVLNGACVNPPPPTCTPPQILQNNVCVNPPPPTCTAPQILENNVCVTPPPPPPPTCNLPNVLVDGACHMQINCPDGSTVLDSVTNCPVQPPPQCLSTAQLCGNNYTQLYPQCSMPDGSLIDYTCGSDPNLEHCPDGSTVHPPMVCPAPSSGSTSSTSSGDGSSTTSSGSTSGDGSTSGSTSGDTSTSSGSGSGSTSGGYCDFGYHIEADHCVPDSPTGSTSSTSSGDLCTTNGCVGSTSGSSGDTSTSSGDGSTTSGGSSSGDGSTSGSTSGGSTSGGSTSSGSTSASTGGFSTSSGSTSSGSTSTGSTSGDSPPMVDCGNGVSVPVPMTCPDSSSSTGTTSGMNSAGGNVNPANCPAGSHYDSGYCISDTPVIPTSGGFPTSSTTSSGSTSGDGSTTSGGSTSTGSTSGGSTSTGSTSSTSSGSTSGDGSTTSGGSTSTGSTSGGITTSGGGSSGVQNPVDGQCPTGYFPDQFGGCSNGDCPAGSTRPDISQPCQPINDPMPPVFVDCGNGVTVQLPLACPEPPTTSTSSGSTSGSTSTGSTSSGGTTTSTGSTSGGSTSTGSTSGGMTTSTGSTSGGTVITSSGGGDLQNDYSGVLNAILSKLGEISNKLTDIFNKESEIKQTLSESGTNDFTCPDGSVIHPPMVCSGSTSGGVTSATIKTKALGNGNSETAKSDGYQAGYKALCGEGDDDICKIKHCDDGRCTVSERLSKLSKPLEVSFSGSDCPKPQINLSSVKMGVLVFDYHCTLLEAVRPTVSAVMSFVVPLTFALIVLGA